jgi:hypothetical protein
MGAVCVYIYKSYLLDTNNVIHFSIYIYLITNSLKNIKTQLKYKENIYKKILANSGQSNGIYIVTVQRAAPVWLGPEFFEMKVF